MSRPATVPPLRVRVCAHCARDCHPARSRGPHRQPARAADDDRGGRRAGVRRTRGDPQGLAQQVRGRPRDRPYPPRPHALHVDRVPRGLRLHREHPGPGRRPARRARHPPGPDVPRLPDQVPRDRHVPDDRRGRRRRQGALRPHRTTRASSTCATSTTSRSSTGSRSSTSSRSTRTSSPASPSRAPSGSAAPRPRPRSRRPSSARRRRRSPTEAAQPDQVRRPSGRRAVISGPRQPSAALDAPEVADRPARLQAHLADPVGGQPAQPPARRCTPDRAARPACRRRGPVRSAARCR